MGKFKVLEEFKEGHFTVIFTNIIKI